MGWNAYLVDDRGHIEGNWDYTHNTAGMANTALDASGFVRPDDTRECWSLPRVDGHLTHYPNGHGRVSWWQCLDGMPGPDGAALLHRIVGGMESDPERYRAMNPDNGWGDYESFLETLSGMRDAVPEWPTEWSAHG